MMKYKLNEMKTIRGWMTPLLLLSFLLLLGTNLQAQSSRAEEIEKKQAEKAQHLAPYVPNRIEKYLSRGEIPYISPRGPYLFLGSAYSGGGFAFGPGYRRLYADNGIFDIHGAYSISGYKLLDTTLKLPDAAGGRLTSLIHARYIDANKVSFFGIGNDTDKDDKTSFTYNPTGVVITEAFAPVRWFVIGGGLEYVDIKTGPGESGSVPSIEEEFTPAEVPGLGLDTTYFAPTVFAQIDFRESLGYTTSGGFYKIQGYQYNEQDNSLFDFRRVDVEGNQFFPILRSNQYLAFRALASFTDVDDNAQVPHYLLPKLGGGQELRGFPDFRFQDRNRMLLTAEYRWTPSKFIDMALFYETGKVASRRGDLDFNDLHDCYGIGIRLHGPVFTAFRIEVAKSNEGTRIIFGAGPVF
jgi:hypothetical protein